MHKETIEYKNPYNDIINSTNARTFRKGATIEVMGHKFRIKKVWPKTIVLSLINEDEVPIDECVCQVCKEKFIANLGGAAKAAGMEKVPY